MFCDTKDYILEGDVMAIKIGNFVKQPAGFKAFVPEKFPPFKTLKLDVNTEKLHTEAVFQLGKLDGITLLLPDLDFFIFMYVRKEATLSSQIEGTKATMIDSIRAEVEITNDLPKDVDDILHYIKAMNYGLNRIKEFPLSLRFLREVHEILMKQARTESFANPGEFRTSQNWIGGGSPATARFVPPPVHEMTRALDDLEKFLCNENDLLPLIKTALVHAQFETIHPFNDGNGRTGRLLTTFYLCQQKILDRPVLYLSEYFKKNRESYFDLLDNYHNKGDIVQWLNFFLEGIAVVAREAIQTCREVTALQSRDTGKMQKLGKSAEKGVLVLRELYKLPIVNVKKVEHWTGLSRVNANKLVDKLVDVGILDQMDKNETYARTFRYKDYLSVFSKK